MAGLELEIRRAERGRFEEDLGPGLAAVAGAEDAALVVVLEGVADGGDEGLVRVGGIDADGGDLAGVAQAAELPGFARIDGLVDAAADGDVGADLGRACTGVDDVGIGLRDLYRAHGAERNLSVGKVGPEVAGVRGAPDAAAHGAHVEGMRL